MIRTRLTAPLIDLAELVGIGAAVGVTVILIVGVVATVVVAGWLVAKLVGAGW